MPPKLRSSNGKNTSSAVAAPTTTRNASAPSSSAVNRPPARPPLLSDSVVALSNTLSGMPNAVKEELWRCFLKPSFIPFLSLIRLPPASAQVVSASIARSIKTQTEGDDRGTGEPASKKARIEKPTPPPISVFEFLRDYTACFGDEGERKALWERFAWLRSIEEELVKNKDRLMAETISWDDVLWKLKFTYLGAVNISKAEDYKDLVDLSKTISLEDYLFNLQFLIHRYQKSTKIQEFGTLGKEMMLKFSKLNGKEVIPIDTIPNIVGFTYALHAIN